MEWEPEMEFQGRQQLANALDLSSRLAQKEQTNQQKQQKQSSLFNALCDQRHENRDDNHEPEEDWKQYLKRADIPLTDPIFSNRTNSNQRGNHSNQGQSYATYWMNESGSKWSTRTSTSGCMSLASSDVPFSDIPEIAWEDASLSESYSDIFSLVDCSNSIATNQDLLDTHSEHNYKQIMPRPSRYASSDISSSEIFPRSIRTSSSLPFTSNYPKSDKNIGVRQRHQVRHRTYTSHCDSSHDIYPEIIHEFPTPAQLAPSNPENDIDRRSVVEEMMKNVDLNGQLDILRIIDPSVDIEQLRKAIIKIPKNHAIDQYTFSKIQHYISSRRNNSTSTSPQSATSSRQSDCPQNSNPPNILRRSNSDPNIADLINNQKAADRRKERDNTLRQRRIFRWLNSQKSQTARRKKQLARERQSGLFLKQEVVEVQNDETIDEQNEEIDVCE